MAQKKNDFLKMIDNRYKIQKIIQIMYKWLGTYGL